MSFANLKTDENINDTGDSVGGGGPLDTDTYECTVSLAYMIKSKKGATGMVLHLTTSDQREIRQSIYMTSGDAKGNKNYYEKDGERNYLPGFLLGNHLALLTVGKEIAELAESAETKMVNVYSPDAKKEVPTEVPVLTELLGHPIIVGVQKQIQDKNQLGDDGKYHPTGETRELNEIDKFFRAKDRMTVTEISAGAEEAAFYNTWRNKWVGVTRDRSTAKASNGSAGAPQVGGNDAAKSRQSIFANNG